MANPYFKFKQFTIWHDKCAMKVGTDGVLLGAWAPVKGVSSVLDVGTGTGLIALMIAQRAPSAFIQAIDVDESAVLQAQDNINGSPWSDCIEVIKTDFKEYQPTKKFDLVVSNPPYFVDSLLPPNSSRSAARHTSSLSFHELISGVVECLAHKGIFAVILPSDVCDSFVALAKEKKLYLNKKLKIQTRLGVEPKRTLLQFSFTEKDAEEDVLLVEIERHKYSDDYIRLTRDFYLKM